MVRERDTRQRVLQTAAQLFARQGYHATGINQILAAGQTPKGSLYFHFPGGKEQIAVEAVALSAAQLGESLRQALGGATDARDGLTRLADVLADQLSASDFLDGCPVAAVAQDTGPSEPIRAACAYAYAQWLAAIDAALRGWGVPAGQSGSLATVLLSAVEGALLLAQVQRDVRALRTVTDHLAEVITAASRA